MSQIKLFCRAAKGGHSWNPEVDMSGLKLPVRREPVLSCPVPLRGETMLVASCMEKGEACRGDVWVAGPARKADLLLSHSEQMELKGQLPGSCEGIFRDADADHILPPPHYRLPRAAKTHANPNPDSILPRSHLQQRDLTHHGGYDC